jgi:hypothetical protein
VSGLNGHDLTARATLKRQALLLVLLATPAFAETREVRILNRYRTGAMPFGPDALVVRPGEAVLLSLKGR